MSAPSKSNTCAAICFSPNKSFCSNQLKEVIPKSLPVLDSGRHGLAGVECPFHTLKTRCDLASLSWI